MFTHSWQGGQDVRVVSQCCRTNAATRRLVFRSALGGEKRCQEPFIGFFNIPTFAANVTWGGVETGIGLGGFQAPSLVSLGREAWSFLFGEGIHIGTPKANFAVAGQRGTVSLASATQAVGSKGYAVQASYSTYSGSQWVSTSATLDRYGVWTTDDPWVDAQVDDMMNPFGSMDPVYVPGQSFSTPDWPSDVNSAEATVAWQYCRPAAIFASEPDVSRAIEINTLDHALTMAHLSRGSYARVSPYNPDIAARFYRVRDVVDNLDNGYRSVLFENNGHFVGVYSGTDQWIDNMSNASQALGLASQYATAVDTTADWIERFNLGPHNFEFTGHSLGGGIAQHLTGVFGIKSTVFNPAGLSPVTAWRYGYALSDVNRLSDAWTVRGDLLTPVQDFNRTFPGNIMPDTAGRIHPIGGWLSRPYSPLERHGIDTVIMHLQNSRKTAMGWPAVDSENVF